jgi:hypothetical protein
MQSIKPFIIVLMFLTGVFAKEQKPELVFKQDGKFKIVQFTDIHLKTDSLKRETTMQVLANVLDAEQPDFVMLTGDVVTSKPATPGWQRIEKMFGERRLPWAAVLGNHDDQQDLSRNEIMQLVEKFPFCVAQPGPQELKGSGNYVLRIKSHTSDSDAALLYCLDSNAYTPMQNIGGYDWLGFSQIEWYRRTSKTCNTGRLDAPLPALAFFHIPLPEYYSAWRSKVQKPIGTREEKECSPNLNSGMFAALLESGDVMAVFVGHDHNNDYAGMLYGICLAYGRATGTDTYGKMKRGARVIELVEGKREFSSWIRSTDGAIEHECHYPDFINRNK